MSSCNRKAPGGGNKSIIPVQCCWHIEVQRLLHGKDVIISPLLGTAVASVQEKLRKLGCRDLKKKEYSKERGQLSEH